MNIFDIKHESSDGKARTGTLHLPHGDVQTPVFMPVGTNATVKALTKDDLDEIGFEIILANVIRSYLSIFLNSVFLFINLVGIM